VPCALPPGFSQAGKISSHSSIVLNECVAEFVPSAAITTSNEKQGCALCRMRGRM
jgi:hypothetical protein